MRDFIQQLIAYLGLAALLSAAAAVLPSFAPEGWMTTTVGVLIWLAASMIGSRAIGWGSTVYLEEIAPRTRSDVDSPFLVNTIRNIVITIFLFFIGGGIATTINEEFNTSFFAGGVGFAVSLGLSPVVGAYILDVRRASIIDGELNEGDYVQVTDVTGFVTGQDAHFLDLLQAPEMSPVHIDHAVVFNRVTVLESFEEVDHELRAIGAVIELYEGVYAYRYIADNGREMIVTVPDQKGVAGQVIKEFNGSIGYYRVLGDPLIELELDADGERAANDPQSLLDALEEWYDELPSEFFDKTFRPKMHQDIYIGKSSIGDGACVPARMITRAHSYQILPEAQRIGQTMIALKAFAGGWGYGTTSNITIGNAADFRG